MSAPPAPEAISSAAAALEARRGELAKAQAAARRAQRAIIDGRAQDNRLVAEARDAGRREPARKHERQAEEEADALAREIEVCQERVRIAGERLNAAIEEGHADWLAQVEEAALDADRAALAAVERLAEALAARNSLLAARQQIQGLSNTAGREAALSRPPRDVGLGTISTWLGANGEPVDAAAMLEALRRHVGETGLEQARAQAQAQREEQQRAREVQAARDAETLEREEQERRLAERPSGPQHIAW